MWSTPSVNVISVMLWLYHSNNENNGIVCNWQVVSIPSAEYGSQLWLTSASPVDGKIEASTGNQFCLTSYHSSLHDSLEYFLPGQWFIDASYLWTLKCITHSHQEYNYSYCTFKKQTKLKRLTIKTDNKKIGRKKVFYEHSFISIHNVHTKSYFIIKEFIKLTALCP